MKKSFWILVLIAIAALITRPNVEDHKRKINREFKGKNPITGALGAGKLFSELVTYHNAYVVSYTTYDEETISIGAFQTVFVFKDLDISQDPSKAKDTF